MSDRILDQFEACQAVENATGTGEKDIGYDEIPVIMHECCVLQDKKTEQSMLDAGYLSPEQVEAVKVEVFTKCAATLSDAVAEAVKQEREKILAKLDEIGNPFFESLDKLDDKLEALPYSLDMTDDEKRLQRKKHNVSFAAAAYARAIAKVRQELG